MTNDCLLTREAPVVLVVAGERCFGVGLRAALEGAGWQVHRAADAPAACAIAAEQPISLVLLATGEVAAAVSQTVASLRGVSAPCAALPILELRSEPFENDPNLSEVDGLVSGSTPELLVRALESWRPVSLAPTRRIAAMFGAGPIAGMIERLARRLEAALAHLDHDGDLDRGEAHRLAGLCGTLGFGQAHAAWLDLSLGDHAAIVEVRRTTRLTLSAVAKGL